MRTKSFKFTFHFLKVNLPKTALRSIKLCHKCSLLNIIVFSELCESVALRRWQNCGGISYSRRFFTPVIKQKISQMCDINNGWKFFRVPRGIMKFLSFLLTNGKQKRFDEFLSACTKEKQKQILFVSSTYVVVVPCGQ